MSGSDDRVRDARRPRVTDNVSSIDTSAGSAFSVYAKDPRRATVLGRQSAEFGPQYPAAAVADNPESGPASFHSQTTASKHFRKLHHSRHPSSSLDTHQNIPSDSRSGGTVPISYSSQAIQSTIRPLSIPQKSPHQSAVASDKVRSRKENARAVAIGDGRHMKQTVAMHSSRGPVPSGELPPMSEVDRGGFALAEGRPVFSGPIASANWEHMQREVEHLRRTVQEFHKVSRKQAKRIEELTLQTTSHHKVIQEKEQEITSLQEKCSKSEKHLTSVESAIQCQICMDLPEKPYTLSPCGHVLCLLCLQEWFKTSLGPVDDDPDEADVSDVLNRDKTCPSCRTVVKHRPCPAFMVKEVVSTFSKVMNSSAQTAQVDGTDNVDDDPWAGIFPNSDDEEQCDIDDFSDDEDDFGIDFPWTGTDRGTTPGFATWTYGTDSDDGAYSEDDDNDQDEAAASEGTVSEDDYGPTIAYVEPRWEPPTVHVEPNSYPLEANDNDLSLLRRGCSWDMVQNFHIRYSHRQGVIVSLRSIDDLYTSDDDFDSSDEEAGRECVYRIYLGWNVSLDENDVDGEAFMHCVLADIKESPERWRLVPRYDGQGSMDVTRLVPAETREDYSTTDTENYLEHGERDLDID